MYEKTYGLAMIKNGLKITAGLLSLMAILTSCSAYKSSGRKSFEERASGNVVTEIENPRIATENSQETCWTQPKSEGLWFLDEAKELVVRHHGQQEIEVCTIPVNGG